MRQLELAINVPSTKSTALVWLEPDHWHHRLLRARRERPRNRRAAEQGDELAPPHVSRATVWRSLSDWLAALSGYHGGTGQVLGTNLKCSESRR